MKSLLFEGFFVFVGIITVGDFMKAKTKLFFKTVIISSWCCAVFVGAGYYYINKNLEPAQNNTESVPYYQQKADNAGVLFEIDGLPTFLYFDFENEKLFASINPDVADSSNIYGYTVDYTVKTDISVLGDIVDYVDGIELDIDNTVLRYTGVQVIEILSVSTSYDLKREIIKGIAFKISQNGIGADLFVSIIENSKTDLKLPDCYFWAESMSKICRNLQIID